MSEQHGLQSSVSSGAVDPDERWAEVACACGERWKAIGNGSLAWVNKRFDEHLRDNPAQPVPDVGGWTPKKEMKEIFDKWDDAFKKLDDPQPVADVPALSEKELNALFQRERQHLMPNGKLASEYREAVGSTLDEVKCFTTAYDWHDKPHRLVYDLLRVVDEYHTEVAELKQGENDRLNAHFNAGQDCERRDCEKALVALAGAGICTPAETYGTNSSWAISDLCRGVTKLQGENQELRQALKKCPISDPTL